MLEEEKESKRRLVSLLRSVPLFSGLDDKDLERIAESGREVSFESGKTILRKGEFGLAFLLVLNGRVEVKKDGKSLAKLGKGQFFGEMTVIDDQPRSADVVAIEPTNCFGLTAWSFDAVVSRNPSIARQMMKELVRRLRQVESSIQSLALVILPQRQIVVRGVTSRFTKELSLSIPKTEYARSGDVHIAYQSSEKVPSTCF